MSLKYRCGVLCSWYTLRIQLTRFGFSTKIFIKPYNFPQLLVRSSILFIYINKSEHNDGLELINHRRRLVVI